MRLLELSSSSPHLHPSLRKRRRQYTEDRLSFIIRTLRSTETWEDPDNTYIRLLQSCCMMNALPEGKQVHIHMLKHGFKLNNHSWFTLISMYAKCGSFLEARYSLNSMPHKTIDSCSVLMGAYTHHNQHEDALVLFSEMLDSTLKLDLAGFVYALNACGGLVALDYGKEIHFCVVEHGHESQLLVQNAMVKMYCKCHDLVDAKSVFACMKERNLVSWTSILSGYSSHGWNEDALTLFQDMLDANIKPDNVALVCVLRVCANMGSLKLGKHIHEYIKRSIFSSDVLLNNVAIAMYAKCGSVKEARRVFDQMQRRDEISWNEIISAYLQHGHHENAFEIVEKMIQEIIKPDIACITMMINTCINLKDFDKCKRVHTFIMKSSFKTNTAVLNNILDMYIKCGAIEEARFVFDQQRKRDVATWKIMILGYVDCECDKEALGLFQLMQEEGIKPNSLTVTGLLNACARLSSLNEGKFIHKFCIINSHESDDYVCSAIVDMYAKCGSIEDAFDVFKKLPDRDVISWNSMIVGFFQNGHNDDVLRLFWAMQREGLTPSTYTFVCTLNACAGLGMMDHGKEIHAHVIQNGLETDTFIVSALVDMYAKSGSLIDAHHVFIKIQNKDVVPWTTIIVGFARHGHSNDAIMLFEQMLEEGVKPNKATYMGILVACTHSGLLEEGYWYFNAMSIEHDISPSVDHYACVVDLFGRAGLLEEAEKFVYKMPYRAHDEIWMTLFSASKIHKDIGLAERAACGMLCDL